MRVRLKREKVTATAELFRHKATGWPKGVYAAKMGMNTPRDARNGQPYWREGDPIIDLVVDGKKTQIALKDKTWVLTFDNGDQTLVSEKALEANFMVVEDEDILKVKVQTLGIYQDDRLDNDENPIEGMRLLIRNQEGPGYLLIRISLEDFARLSMDSGINIECEAEQVNGGLKVKTHPSHTPMDAP